MSIRRKRKLSYAECRIRMWENWLRRKLAKSAADPRPRISHKQALREIHAGNRSRISARDEAVADLVPIKDSRHPEAAAAVDEMLAFMQARKSVDNIDFKALIDEGRL